jgi:putative sigma-54 modulation protein
MKINITSRHFKASENLQNYINNKLEELTKYNEDVLHADVILSEENTILKSCEILVKLRHELVVAKETSDEFEKAIEKAVEKIDAQVYKLKDKQKTQKHNTDTEIYKTI